MGCCPSSPHAAAANKANENGATPLYIACDKGHVDAARLLLDKGAEVDRADVQDPQNEGSPHGPERHPHPVRPRHDP